MTRITKHRVGDIVHCILRGTRGDLVFNDISDYYRGLRQMYSCNDTYRGPNYSREEKTLEMFTRHPHWPSREPYVDIISFALMPNHIHLLLKERIPGGIGRFMASYGNSLSKGYNAKYGNRGTIFQGKYMPVVVDSTEHLIFLIYYINIKNVLELYPHGGLAGALANFDAAYEWAQTYIYSSNRVFTQDLPSPIISREAIDMIVSPGVQAERLLRFMVGHDKDIFKKQAFEAVKLSLSAKDMKKGEMSETRRKYLQHYRNDM